MTFMSKVIFPLSFLSIGKLSVIMVTTHEVIKKSPDVVSDVVPSGQT